MVSFTAPQWLVYSVDGLFGTPQVNKAKMEPSIWGKNSTVQIRLKKPPPQQQKTMSDYWVSFIEFVTLAMGGQGHGNQVS